MNGNPYDRRMYYGTTEPEEELTIDLDSSDEELGAYIEARRMSFYDEWLQYLRADERESSLYALS